MYDVIVIGGGACGVTIANHINTYAKVCILEASTELGGRAKTSRLFDQEVNIGAEYMHFHNQEADPYAYQMMQIIERLEMGVVPIPGKVWLPWLCCEWIDCSDVLKAQHIDNFTKDERPFNYWESFIWKRLYEHVGKNTIRSNQLKDAEHRNVLALNQTLTHPLGEDGDWLLDGSFQRIIEYLGRDLEVKRDHVVTQVERTEEGYRISGYGASAPFSFEARQVCVTVPIGVLKQNRIRFVPDLPERVKVSIDTIQYGCHNKVILNCATNDETVTYHAVKGSILHWQRHRMWVGHVLSCDDVSIDEIKRHVEHDMVKLHLTGEYHIVDWRENDFAGNGSYSYLQHSSDSKHVLSFKEGYHDNTLFFGGEACDLDGFQTVRGAINSGRWIGQQLEKQILHLHASVWTACDHFKYCILAIDRPTCGTCNEIQEIWKCTKCGEAGCGRYRNRCSVRHYERTGHCNAIAFPERSVWCYRCDAYVYVNSIEVQPFCHTDQTYHLFYNANICVEETYDYVLQFFQTMEGAKSSELCVHKVGDRLRIQLKMRDSS